MSGADTGLRFDRKWFRLGVAITFLYATFTVVLVWLLTVDVTLGIAFAVVGGTLGAIALSLYVLYVH